MQILHFRTTSPKTQLLLLSLELNELTQDQLDRISHRYWQLNLSLLLSFFELKKSIRCGLQHHLLLVVRCPRFLLTNNFDSLIAIVKQLLLLKGRTYKCFLRSIMGKMYGGRRIVLVRNQTDIDYFSFLYHLHGTIELE